MSDNLLPPWKPGQSGNPAGKPKGARNRSTIYRELMDAAREGDVDKTNADAVVAALFVKALEGDVAAARELFDSGYGKVSDKTSIEHSGSIGIQQIIAEQDGRSAGLPGAEEEA